MKTKSLLPLLGAVICATSLTSCYVYDDPLSWSAPCAPSYGYGSGYYPRTSYRSSYCPPTIYRAPRPVYQSYSPPCPTPSYGHFHRSSAPAVIRVPSSQGHHSGGSHMGHAPAVPAAPSGGGFHGGHGGHSGGDHGHHGMTSASVAPSVAPSVPVSVSAPEPVSIPTPTLAAATASAPAETVAPPAPPAYGGGGFRKR